MAMALLSIVPSSEHHDSSLDDGTESVHITCSFCGCLGGAYISIPDYHGPYLAYSERSIKDVLFHKPSRSCQDGRGRSLCRVREHMRLGHVVQCMLDHAPMIQKQLGSMKRAGEQCYLAVARFILGTVQDIQERPEYCQTCRLLLGRATERPDDKLRIPVEQDLDEPTEYLDWNTWNVPAGSKDKFVTLRVGNECKVNSSPPCLCAC
jgi:hypothetical protein